MSGFYHEKSSEFRVGDRVQLHPALDAWVRGDRFGTVTKARGGVVFVQLDKSGRTRWFAPASLEIVEG